MGETAILLRLDDVMDEAINAQVHALSAAIHQAGMACVIDIVPAYASVLVCHRPLSLKARDHLQRKLLALAHSHPSELSRPTDSRHEIPVCYGGAHGPDLASLAQVCHLSAQQVIDLHCATEYRVAMTGFAPGFPYLLGLDPRLSAPRRNTPRTRVATGSVGIAGLQTGIYPGELPGGWQLIGRTPLALFQPRDANHPCRLVPGDQVHFQVIDEACFEAMREASC